MSADGAISPLKIHKSTASLTSPASPAGSSYDGALPRILADISPAERRRNSPSYNQLTKQVVGGARDSSPFDSEPYGTASPRQFWQRGASPARFSSENTWRDSSSPTISKRPSVERLKQASRVKNSSMFAREQHGQYDPTAVPVVERPLAANRPLSQLQGNAFGGRNLEAQKEETSTSFKGHRRGKSSANIPLVAATRTEITQTSIVQSVSPSPLRGQTSPLRSSLSNRPGHNTFPRGFDPSTSIWSDEDDIDNKVEPARPLRRQAKSVTFDTAPPEINEYEMITPDPSVASVASGSREGSYDDYDNDSDIDLGCGPNEDEDSFDASLEDTDKTPVVLPEDWRHMSPAAAAKGLANTFDDPFSSDGYTMGTPSKQWDALGSMSVTSDEDSRPLPPVPPFSQPDQPASPREAMSITDRIRAAHARSLPTPPRPASATKADIIGTQQRASMTLEDRLRLMGLQDDSSSPKDGAAREAARLTKHGLGIHVREEEVFPTSGEILPSNHYVPPKISRESILRTVKSRSLDRSASSDKDLVACEEQNLNYADLDPDVPIPSRETSSNFDDVVCEEQQVKIKEEEKEASVDVYTIPDYYASGDPADEFNREGSVIRHDVSRDSAADESSCYSPDVTAEGAQQPSSNSATDDDDGPPTPRQESVIRTSTPAIDGGSGEKGDMADFSLIDDTDFQMGLASYLSASSTPPPPPEKDVSGMVATASTALNMSSVHDFMQRPHTPPADDLPADDHAHPVDGHGTPDSVLHHPVAEEDAVEEPEERTESPSIPDEVASIKAPNGKLKTRPSNTPADLATMAAARRRVSGPEPPPIPEDAPKKTSEEGQEIAEVVEQTGAKPASMAKRRKSFKGIDLSIDDSFGEDISFGLDKEFDRVMESTKVPSTFHFSSADGERLLAGASLLQNLADLTPRTKKGYLMRQNTKMVVAKRNFSNESGLAMPPNAVDRTNSAEPGTKSAGSSPHKAKSWTTEPWNGKARRKSIRTLSGGKPAVPSGPVPPLPGQESNAVPTGLDTVDEYQDFTTQDEDEEGVEKGRLFVKVVGVKELELPLPQNERSYFQLTLDNGLHCVTTSWLELGRTAPIGQEFELVVLNDLEFQLTLQTKLTPPAKPEPVRPVSPTKLQPPEKKKGFGHLLMSPKKRREQERQARERQEQEDAQRIAAERQMKQNAERERAAQGATAWDLLHELVGSDGSFGRAYVCLKNHENQCFGRPLTVDIPLFNEWALEDQAFASSVKSKRGGAVRRPPYQLGKLTLQLLYVPRPKGSSEDEMPRSLNACVRELREAEEADNREFEGFLSQQGGDCPYWRRRFFRLVGSKLTAYHESTRQPRAKIDLAKASKLIDDRSSLVANPAGGKGGKGRRKSAFAEEDEGYQFVEEGFRIRFQNGETIDFYADSAAEKDQWMRVLSVTVGKLSADKVSDWTKLVLAHERRLAPPPTVPPKIRRAEDISVRPQSADGPLTEHSRASPGKKSVTNRHSAAPLQQHARALARTDKTAHAQMLDLGKDVPAAGTPRTTAAAAPPPTRDHRRPLTPQLSSQARGRLSARRKEVKSMLF